MSDGAFERAIRDWIDVGSDRTPRGAIDSALLAVRTTPQEHGLRVAPWLPSVRLLRRASAATAVMLLATVAAGGLLYAIGTGAGTRATESPSAPSKSAVPAAQDPSPKSDVPATQGPPLTVLASDGVMHVGWVYVYVEGLVVLRDDGGRTYERRLTPDALEQIRSGTIGANAVLMSSPTRAWRTVPPTPLPETLWAEPDWRSFEPVTFAVCYGYANQPVSASEAVPLLPAGAQALLRGKERTYVPDTTWVEEWGASPGGPVQCSELAPADAFALAGALGGWDTGPGPDGGTEVPVLAPRRPPFCQVPDCTGYPSPAVVFVYSSAVMPHGTWVEWGG